MHASVPDLSGRLFMTNGNRCEQAKQVTTYGGFLDVGRMWQVNILEEVEQALQRVVLPLPMVLIFPTEREEIQ